MKITDLQCLYLRLPQVEAIASGVQDALILLIHTDEGVTGIGEADSSPSVIRAIVEAPMSHSLAAGLRHLLVGEDPLERERLWRKLYEGTYYFGRRGAVLHALSAVDMALWDIAGKVAGLPIFRLLGAHYRDRVRAYGSVLFPETPEEARKKAESLFEKGFTAVKFGWGGFGKDWKKDVAFVRALREAAGDDRDILIDAGMCWDAATSIRMVYELAPYRPFWLEEPLSADDLDGYRR
ncbi:MAG: mandelate racemase/muconate lactonizing enzyme family protein, partial [Armatimonadetes bacterium]|nr:mandelate racemase/muconate lactonizing enzyme family protein [Armatimonadota bacterium]MDW8123048.1 mandelate racemase/muconate lactonizing enzyme family protein [Armatimonadota bacterium]